MKKLKNTMRCLVLSATLLMFSMPAAADALDDVLDVMVKYGGLDPAIVDARDMLNCLVAHNGDAGACFNIPTNAEKQAGKAASNFMPDDPKVRGVINLVFAVQKEQWLDVIELAGLDILSPLICENATRAGGPVGSWFCSGPFKDVIANYAEPVVEEAFALINNGGLDLGTLLELVALLADLDRSCALIPDEIPGVSEACSLLGQIIAEIGGVFVDAAKYGAKIVVAGADEVENLIFGDDSHMPYDQYYALYWLPWLHKSVNLCITANCAGGRDIRESIWDRCVDYFDSHNQYRSTAEKTCDDMRDKRYHKATNLLAEAMLEGARSYVRTIHAGAKAWAITEYGKNSDSAIRSHFLSLCETELEQGYPLTSGTPAMCDAYKNVSLPGFQQFYKSCMSQVAAQQVSPTAWRNSCKKAEPEFVVMLQTEKQSLQGKLSNLAAEGCAPPQGWSAQQGLRLQCRTYTGYDQCMTAMVVGANSICSVDRSKADAARAKEILAFLGNARCSLSGNEVLCHRPWKHIQCQKLIKGTPRIQLSKTSLACSEESLDYYKIAFANQALLEKVNFPIARGGQGPACNWIEDKAKIRCLRIDILEARLAAKPELQRPVCKVDPNYDGSDTSCYLKPYNVKTAPQQDTVSVSSTAAGTLQQPGGTVGYDTPYQITGGAAPDSSDRSTRMTPASAGSLATVPVEPLPTAEPARSANARRRADPSPGATTRSAPLPQDAPPATTIGAVALPTQAEAAPRAATARTAAPALRAMNAMSNEQEAPPNACSMDVTYYVPKPPIIETSSPSLQVGHQVQIQCGFEKRTRQLEWQQCDDEAKATMSSLKFSQESGSRYSGMMIVDDANIGIASSPEDGASFDNTGTWIFNEAGSHEVTCQVDNGLHYAGTGSPVYLQAGASVRVGVQSGPQEFRGFEPGTARRVPTTLQPGETAPIGRNGRMRLSDEALQNLENDEPAKRTEQNLRRRPDNSSNERN